MHGFGPPPQNSVTQSWFAPQVIVPQDLRPPLVAVTKPDGSLEVELDDRYQSRITATVGADGRVHLGCVTGDDAHDHAGE